MINHFIIWLLINKYPLHFLYFWFKMCCRCSWYIFPHLGETVRWHPWIQTSLIVTASQPVALTVKHATWWTTATVAWCTCLVGNHSYWVLSQSYINDSPEINVHTSKPRKAEKKNLWCECVLLWLQEMHRTAPQSCTKSVLTQLSVRKSLLPRLFWIFMEQVILWHSCTDLFQRSGWALVFFSPDFLVERDNDFCVCETPCNMTRYSKELSFVKIPSKASAKYLAKKYNKSEQYIK